MHALRVIESLEMQVELPMLMEVEIVKPWIWQKIGVLVSGHVILKHVRGSLVI